ncbi:MAG: TauD/TfdA family dioxygenase, partial [Blastocatellia bacterium]
NENSFNRTWPMKIWFCCMRPADEGGETPIVDSRKVFNLIAPDVRNRFVEKKVMYQRNYGDGTGLDWQTVFQTADKSEVERRCKEALVDFTWKEGDRLRTRAVRPAVVKHPGAGELVWFNQAQHWHTSCLDPATRDSMTSLFTEEDLPRACYYGDGSLIEDSVMEEILKVYKKLEVVFPWRKADILMLDNRLTAHGRNPYAGKRSMLVAMGSMSGFENI